MQFLEEEIIEITATTWQSMLGLDIQSDPKICDIADPDGFLTGRVEIHGRWNGVVVIQGAEALARSAAAIFFSLESTSVTERHLLDAICELSNIIGGNIKACLPEPCTFSFPTATRATAHTLEEIGAEKVSEFRFRCQGQPLYVTVWKEKT